VSGCAIGFEQSQPPTLSTDRVCSQCDGVTRFQSLANQLICQMVSNCSAGTFIAVNQTYTSDRQCLDCPSLTYQVCNGMGMLFCIQWFANLFLCTAWFQPARVLGGD
jgi:hypothetical protein